MNSFLSDMLLDTSEKAEPLTTSSSNLVSFSIIDDNAKLPHYTLRAHARLSPEESEEMSAGRWRSSVENFSPGGSSNSFSLFGSPRTLTPRKMNRNSNNSPNNGGCQPVCPQRRPSDPSQLLGLKGSKTCKDLILSDETLQMTIRECLLADGDYLDEDEE